MAVGSRHDGGVVGGFGTALDLQAVHPGIPELREVVDGAHVPGVHDVAALLVLKDREVLSRALLLHQGVLVAAGLGALAPVGIPAGHVVAEQAAPGVADAHGPVAEGLDLQLLRRLGPDLRDLGKAQLPGQHHPAGAQVVPGPGALVVRDGLLGGDVALTPGSVLSRKSKDSQIRQDQGVHPGVLEELQVRREAYDLVVPWHGVHSAVDLDAVLVGEGHGFGQLLRGEIPGEGPHPEGGTREIHGVRPVENGHPQPFPVSCRSQQLRHLPLIRHSRRWPGRRCAQRAWWRSGACRPCPGHSSSNLWSPGGGRHRWRRCRG